MPNWLAQALALDDYDPPPLIQEERPPAKICVIDETRNNTDFADFGTRSQIGRSSLTDLLEEWVNGFACLSPELPPCPSFRRWYEVHRASRRFVETHASDAVVHGWTTLELWGAFSLGVSAIQAIRSQLTGFVGFCVADLLDHPDRPLGQSFILQHLQWAGYRRAQAEAVPASLAA